MTQDVKLYGKTTAEKLLAEKQQSREIVKEILEFNVSERQLYQLIKLLADNLENYHHMSIITWLVDELEKTDIGDLTGLKEKALQQLTSLPEDNS